VSVGQSVFERHDIVIVEEKFLQNDFTTSRRNQDHLEELVVQLLYDSI